MWENLAVVIKLGERCFKHGDTIKHSFSLYMCVYMCVYIYTNFRSKLRSAIVLLMSMTQSLLRNIFWVLTKVA